ncbi:peptidylprolyl isomerase [Entomomonas asaccharolytica]|uniref:Chaperone SurA n=1 Tax=Entomomonas asaccharolytica TaxID=2785331 RepID=A0A974RXV3_9GAMM|nr:peptidylprolyl isomerase [Entomomonas asaccharolytica]
MKIKVSNFWLVLFSILLVFSGVASAQVKSLDRVIAIVDDDVIMKSQLDSRVQEVLQTVSKRGGDLPPQDVLVKQVLDRLIVEDLQIQLANRYGITADDDEVNQAVADVAKRNNLNMDQFQKVLLNEGLSLAALRDQIRREILINRVRQRVIGEKIRITDQEVKNFLNSEIGKAQLSEEYYLASILVPVSQGSSYAAIQKAEQKATDIYRQLENGADFAKLAMTSSSGDKALEGGEIGWRQAAQLPPPFDQLINGLKVGDFTQPVSTPGGLIILKVMDKRGGAAHLQDETSVRHILLKPSQIRSEEDTKKLADRLYQRIMAGEDFAQLAKSFSDDPGSAHRGGSLNWIDPNTLVPEFRNVMDGLPVGQISQPFKSRYGWHILQVEGRRSTDNSAEYRKQQAMNILYGRKYDQELQIWLQQLRDEAYVEIKL